MIYLELFLIFLEIGLVSFGGGYGMISLIREKMLSNGWLTEEELLNMIAVSESTPGPIAVNMATFVGSSQGGIFGSFVAILGVILPSFVIILIIAAVIRNFLKYKQVNAFLSGVRPIVVGLIVATGLIMLLSKLIGFSDYHSNVNVDIPSIIIFAVIISMALIWKKIKKKAISPILMIIISAGLGILVYSFF